LTDLQRSMRTPAVDDGSHGWWTVPEDLMPAERTDPRLMVTREQNLAVEATERAVAEDPSLEHLGDKARDVVRKLAIQCALRPKRDFVRQFADENAKDLETLTCFVAVDSLRVKSPLECAAIRFLPANSDEIPDLGPLPNPFGSRDIGSVAQVEVAGTDPSRMAERGQGRVRHALRVPRIALREHPGIADRQLRFRVGSGYVLGSRQVGMRMPPNAAWELELGPALIEVANKVEVIKQNPTPMTGLDKQVDIAIRWMERAWFTDEPEVALLFLFFALEALLGDKASVEKGHLIAFRQIMLSHVLTGGFADPDRTFLLYDRARSDAAHGGDASSISDEVVRGFAATVRWTLNQYLIYARQNGFQRRGKLVAALDAHPDRSKMADWLKLHGGPWWTDYFDKYPPP
jgi:hypothetical protein